VADDAARDQPQKTHWWYVLEGTNRISAIPKRGFIPASGWPRAPYFCGIWMLKVSLFGRFETRYPDLVRVRTG